MSIPDEKELLIRLEVGDCEISGMGFFQEFDSVVDCSFETVNSVLSFPVPRNFEKTARAEFFFRLKGWEKFQKSLELYLDDAKQVLEEGYASLSVSYAEIRPMDYKVLYWDDFQICFDYESIETCPKTTLNLWSLYDLDDFNKEVFKKCQENGRK